MVESMQQSSATPKNRDVGRGLRKIVACSQPYLAVASCIYSFWHGVIPTSYFRFLHLYITAQDHTLSNYMKLYTQSKGRDERREGRGERGKGGDGERERGWRGHKGYKEREGVGRGERGERGRNRTENLTGFSASSSSRTTSWS